MLIDKNNTNIDQKINREILEYTDKKPSKNNSKELSVNSKSVTPRNKNLIDVIDNNNTSYKKTKLIIPSK